MTTTVFVNVNRLMDEASELLLASKFNDAIARFDKVLEIDPQRAPFLWQRGIALFFAERYVDGVAQFEKDMTVNGRDTEETIWRFLCAAKASSIAQARQEYIEPQKGDLRVPMAEILSLFSGSGSEEAVMKAASEGTSSSVNRENHLFYAHYYMGAFLEVQGDIGKAYTKVHEAISHRCSDFMYKVAKVHELYLARKLGHKRPSLGGLALLPTEVTRAKLADGYSCSKVIRGCWQLSKGHQLRGEFSPAETIVEDFSRFLDTGVTAFDVGDIYTGAEDILGKFIRHARDIAELSGKEPDIQVHTKFIPDEDVLGKVDYNYCKQDILRSLNRLSVESLDLVQFHWWNFAVSGYIAAANHLVTLQQEGLLRHIGVTNFDVKHLKELVDAGIPIVSNQVQYSLLDQRPQLELAEFCANHNIKLIAYGSLAGGFLSEKWLGQPEPEQMLLGNRSLIKYKLIIDEIGGWSVFQNLLQTLNTIAEKHETTIPTVAIRWVLDQPQVAAAVVGSRDSSKLDGVLPQAFTLRLSDDDKSAISKAQSNFKPVPGDVYGLERDKTGPHGRIMKYNLSRLNQPEHFNELCLRYVELMHRLHPERASEQGLRVFDTQLSQTSVREQERTAITLERYVKELDSIDSERLDDFQLADLLAIRFDANLRLFRIQKIKEAQNDPFLYLSPAYRGIRFLAGMIGRIPRAEFALLQRVRKFILTLKNGIERLQHPHAYLATSAIRYSEGLIVYFDGLKQKSMRTYEENLLDETARQLSAACTEVNQLLGQFSNSLQTKMSPATSPAGMGRDAYTELVREHLQPGLTLENLQSLVEGVKTNVKKELQAIIMALRASSPPSSHPNSPPSNTRKSFSIGRRRSIAMSPPVANDSPPSGARSPNSISPVASVDTVNASQLSPPTQHGRSFSFNSPFNTHTRSFSFGRRRSSTTAEVMNFGQPTTDAEAEKLYRDAAQRTKSYLVAPSGLFSTWAKLASLIDEEAAILNNIASGLPDHISLSTLRCYSSGDIAVQAIHDTIREFMILGIRLNSGPRQFALDGFPSLLSEGCVLYLVEVLIQSGFFADHEYQRQRALHRRLVLATRAILEIKLHSGEISPDEFKLELMAQCEFPEKPAEDMARQSLREPTMAAASVLGFEFLQQREQTYFSSNNNVLPSGSAVASHRKFLDYILAGDGLCLELTKQRRN